MTLPDHAAIRKAAQAAAAGVEAALTAYRNGRVADEHRLVERVLTEIEHAVARQTIGGLTWEAGTLTSSRRKGGEAQFGADFLGVFIVRLPNYKVAKGFLAQAKLLPTGNNLGAAERKRLQSQCRKMLAHTPDAFALILQPRAATFVPAVSIVAGDNEPLQLYQRGPAHFFEEHFACFIGDQVFAQPNARVLDQIPELQDRYDVRHVLVIVATDDPGGMDYERSA